MIDSHAHLEQKDYSEDLDSVISRCKEAGMIGIVTSSANPKDFEKTMKISQDNPGFVFPSVGIHPEYIKELSIKQIDDQILKIKENKDKIYAIGEVGLDYFWTKEEEYRKQQQKMFRRMIQLAIELKKPLVIHSRNAMDDTIQILKEEGAKNVLMHLFGSKAHIQTVIDNGWNISIGPLIKRSKDIRKIARDMPLDKIMLETDSPWFGEDKRGEPTNIKIAAEYIARYQKIEFEKVWKTCAQNSIKFFNLPLKI
ncbi:MAG: TatD family hydrolase [Candidatus Aenigmarchaeota archaeon]|nr:TatD family hydrolase [Candidatus Aenigmarchaeota archaeon]